MHQPQRIQRKRTKGYRMPENTVSVTRPGKWGNPFSVADVIKNELHEAKQSGFVADSLLQKAGQQRAVQLFRDMMMSLDAHAVSEATRIRFRWMRDRIRDLEGKNLACYCKPGEPCHADILIELANPVVQ